MKDLVRLDIVITKEEARHLMKVIEAGNTRLDAPSSETYEAIDDIHTELYEATSSDAAGYGFQNRMVISPTAFPLYDSPVAR